MLQTCMNQKNVDKDARERSDMVIFSILLLVSRLIPSFQLTDSNNLLESESLNESNDA